MTTGAVPLFSNVPDWTSGFESNTFSMVMVVSLVAEPIMSSSSLQAPIKNGITANGSQANLVCFFITFQFNVEAKVVWQSVWLGIRISRLIDDISRSLFLFLVPVRALYHTLLIHIPHNGYKSFERLPVAAIQPQFEDVVIRPFAQGGTIPIVLIGGNVVYLIAPSVEDEQSVLGIEFQSADDEAVVQAIAIGRKAVRYFEGHHLYCCQCFVIVGVGIRFDTGYQRQLGCQAPVARPHADGEYFGLPRLHVAR